MTIVSSYSDLLELLQRDGVLHQAEPAARSVRIPTERDGVEGVQLIRWQDADAVVQFVQSMPVEVPPARVAAVEAAAARLNHALAWPGLDVDAPGGRVALRLVVPLLPRDPTIGLLATEVRAAFRAAVRAAADLLPTVRRVIAGEIAPEDAVADVRRELDAHSPTGARPIIFPID